MGSAAHLRWEFVLHLVEEDSGDSAYQILVIHSFTTMSSFPLFHLFRTALFYSIWPVILMSSNNVPLGSIFMQILTLEDIYVEWLQIKMHKCMTLAAQLHLLDTLNNAM